VALFESLDLTVVIIDYLVLVALGFPGGIDRLSFMQGPELSVVLLDCSHFFFERSFLRNHCIHLGFVFGLPDFALCLFLVEILKHAFILVDQLLVSL
jgi:hypothetical protein